MTAFLGIQKIKVLSTNTVDVDVPTELPSNTVFQ